MQESILNQMPQPVKASIIFPQHLAVFSWRNDWRHALLFGLLDNGLAVITFVCQQIICTQAFDESGCKAAIRSGACCNNDSERQTKRIHGQMCFRVEPPFERPIA